jgi:hypothetical protein
MLLSNLMDTWGDDEGLRSSKILEALKLNQKQVNGGPRFSVERVDSGDIKIIVHPKCGHVEHFPRQPLQRRHRAHSSEDVLSIRDKMGMDLEDIITNERGSSSCSKPDIIDLTDENLDVNSLRPPSAQHPLRFASTGWAKSRQQGHHLVESRSDGTLVRHDQSLKVKVSKFVAYLVKRGHAEAGITLWEGWANLNDLMRVINQQKAYGNFTLQELKNVLQDTDDVGRFRYWNDWLRKVDKADRQLPQASNHRLPDQRPVPMPPPMEVDPATAALNYTGPDVTLGGQPLPPSSDNGLLLPPPPPPLGKGAPADSRPPPPRPPGIGWTQYNDDGKFWWYYEGPQGKWWCDDENEPMPWTFDD